MWRIDSKFLGTEVFENLDNSMLANLLYLSRLHLSSMALLCGICFTCGVHAQASHRAVDGAFNEHGTCAITSTAPFGVAFIVDSRITMSDDDGRFVSQKTGCKVLLARPTILLAGVGLVDTSGFAGHWNSLDAASEELKSLPMNPTILQLNDWSYAWGQTLVKHFRDGKQTPRVKGEVADILLVTKIDGKPYYRRAGVEWNGTKFIRFIEGQVVDPNLPALHYAGSCRYFARVNDGSGHMLPIRVKRIPGEQTRFEYYGKRQATAKSVGDLADVVFGIESVSTDIDTRLEGKQAVIAPPYSTAQWPEEANGWQTNFNAECRTPAAAANS